MGDSSPLARNRSSKTTPVESSSGRLPVAFVGHGAPTLALDSTKGAELAALGRSIEKPRAILVISAHWQTRAPTIGSVQPRPLVYDFTGFPERLYHLRYPSPGAADLGRRVENLLRPWAVARAFDRGLDHGAWGPLVHMFPAAETPVLQLSLASRNSGADLIKIGAALAPLRAEGVFIFGSGSLTHNLRLARLDDDSPPPAWAIEFDAWCAEVLSRWDLDALADYRNRAPALLVAHPTEEHFLPLLVAAGAASTGSPAVTYPVCGFEHRSVSRRSVRIQ
jgi:4,5-DOPA dioxygenase extradiol